MQDRIKLNKGINKLKQVFDIIEPYDPNDNIGYRSLKNIGVWLIAYALTEKSQQLEVVQDLLRKADMLSEIKSIKEIIDVLSRADNLTSIINDYAKAHGKFKIIIKDSLRLNGLKTKAKAVGLSELIDKHLEVDPSKDADLIFDMNNTIKFSWQDTDHHPAEFAQDKKISFNNEGEISYLTANSKDHSVAYDLVKLNDDLYHVVRFGALQNDDKDDTKKTAVYLIEPVDQKTDPTAFQKNYFDIVSLFKKNGDYQKRYAEIKEIEKKSTQKKSCN